MKCSAPSCRRRPTPRTSMPFVRLSSLASLSLRIQLLALALPSGPSSLVVSAHEHVYNGFEYDFSVNTLHWKDHEEQAVAWGGHLASVHSEEEYKFMLDLRVPNQRYFLGGKHNRRNEMWEWSDGSPWNFEDWAEDEPSHINESRLEIKKDGEWNDAAISSYRQAIYKRRIAPSAAPSSSPPTASPVVKPTSTAPSIVMGPPTASPVIVIPIPSTDSPVVRPTSAAPSAVLKPTASPVAALPTPSPVVPVPPGTRSSTANSGISGWLIFLFILLALILFLAFVFPGYKTILAYFRKTTIDETRNTDFATDDSNSQSTPLIAPLYTSQLL